MATIALRGIGSKARLMWRFVCTLSITSPGFGYKQGAGGLAPIFLQCRSLTEIDGQEYRWYGFPYENDS
jgi:hypothetical protein